MKLVIVVGVIISLLGVAGLLTCIFKGIKIKRLELTRSHDSDEVKSLLGKLYTFNMISLSASFLGLLIVIIGIIFAN